MHDGPASRDGHVLAVDLDGTLLRSDLLFESLWGGLARAPRGTLAALGALGPGGAGRAGLKQRLARLDVVDPALLPYDPEVLDHVRRWTGGGGRAILVTASDQHLADAVAAHLGLFEAAHGSDGRTNLKGARKADFLRDRYGADGYIYMGDAQADLPVWAGAAEAVTVGAPQVLRARVAALGIPVRHLGAATPPLGPWLRALRPHQWLKNVLVFVPVLASHNLEAQSLLQSLVAFVAFSLVASSVYLVNDLLDLSADRRHPRKRLRALASGAIPIGPASLVALLLLAGGLALSVALGTYFAISLLIYYAMTTAYSLQLKSRTVVDIWVLAMLYSMRIVAGAAATGIVPSVWLMAFSIFFFFSLAATKRQAELVDIAGHEELSERRRGYHREDMLLVAMMAISSGYVSVLVMALYIRTPFVDRLYGFPPALLGICLVLLYWISRVVMVTHRGKMHDDPLVFAMKDRISQLCLLACLGFALAATYL